MPYILYSHLHHKHMQSIEDYFNERYRTMVEKISASGGEHILHIMSSCLPFGVHTNEDAVRAIGILPSWVIASMHSTMVCSPHPERMKIFIEAIQAAAKQRGMSLYNCAGCKVEVKQFEKYCETCAHVEYS